MWVRQSYGNAAIFRSKKVGYLAEVEMLATSRPRGGRSQVEGGGGWLIWKVKPTGCVVLARCRGRGTGGRKGEGELS